MAETRTELRNTAPVRLLPLDIANALLPYDRPLSDYLTGKAGAEYPRRKGIWHPAAEFLYELRWKDLDGSLTAAGWDEFDTAKGHSGARHLWQQVQIEPPPPPAPVEKEQERKPAMPRPRPVTPNRTPSGKPAFEVPIIRDLGKAEPGPAARPAPPRPAAAPAPGPKPVMAPPAAAAAKPAAVAKPVTVPLPAPKPAAAPVAPPKPVVAPKPAPAVAAKAAAAVVEQPALEARTVETPAPEPARPVVAKPAPPPPPKPVEKVETPAPAVETKPEPIAVPSFGGVSGSSSSYADALPEPGGASVAVKVGIPVVILAVLGGGAYYIFSGGEPATKKGADSAQTLTVGEQGWVTEWASDAGGSRRGRQLTLYRQSMTLSDYKLKFTGTIETGALGWVFRAADTKNYYAMKIAVTRPGPVPSLAVTRMAVVDGRESSYNEKPLAVPVRADLTFNVEVDVKGPNFTVYVQGQPVDVWTDSRLRTGGIGFMTERDERARTTAVQFEWDNKKR